MKKIKNNSWKFDDCLICQTMEKADEKGKSLTAQELEDAFTRQNDKNKSINHD